MATAKTVGLVVGFKPKPTTKLNETNKMAPPEAAQTEVKFIAFCKSPFLALHSAIIEKSAKTQKFCSKISLLKDLAAIAGLAKQVLTPLQGTA